jgi:outer membrane immunogenic protein
MKKLIIGALFCGLTATGGAANAQYYNDPYAEAYHSSAAETLAGPYAGIQLGYQEVATIDLPTIGGNGTELNVDGATIGGYLGYNIPLGDSLVLGVEGGANFGTDQLDNDYTVSGHLGIATGENSMVFLRGGYQWVDLDVADLTSDLLGRPLTQGELAIANAQDDTASGVLIGAGVQFGLGRNAHLRATVDTIEFDTYRIAAGLGVNF